MGKQISDWLYRVSRGWVALAALLIFLLFMALVLPRQAAQAEQLTGDARSPDTSFVYTSAELYDIAAAYGPEGRAAYITSRFRFDLAFPLVYVTFLATAISWLFARAFSPGSRWRLANLVPLAGGLFDLLENLATSLVMGRYPDPTPGVDVLAPVLSLAKWLFVGAAFLLLAAGAVIALTRALSRRPRPTP